MVGGLLTSIMNREPSASAVGIIGGSGLYQLEGLDDVKEHAVKTPFGDPSDVIFGGILRVARCIFSPVTGGVIVYCLRN